MGHNWLTGNTIDTGRHMPAREPKREMIMAKGEKHVWRVVCHRRETVWNSATMSLRLTGHMEKSISSKRTEASAIKDTTNFNRRWQAEGGWAYYGEREA